MGIQLKQTFAKEGKALRRRAGGYAHARQFKHLRKVLRRQKTVLGKLIRELRRKLPDIETIPEKLQEKVQTVLCAAGYNLRWLLRAVARLGLKGFFVRYALWVWLSVMLRKAACREPNSLA